MSMDCETFRSEVEADPATLGPECAAHEAACPACAAHAARLRRLEGLLGVALRFELAAASEARRPAPRRRGLAMVSLALVAGLVGGLAVWIGIGFETRTDPEGLTAAVLAHWPLEPESWVVTDQAVPRPELEQVLSPQARVDLDRLGRVTYVHLCWVHGHWIPHLVVQGRDGPVMLLLLPDERIDKTLSLELRSAHLKGAVIPRGKGSIAVLGSEDEPLGPLRERVASAIEWNG